MSKHRTSTVPKLSFGSTRTGSLVLSVGARGRVTCKGDVTWSLPEAHAFVAQLLWFLEQVAAHQPSAPRPPSSPSPRSTQLDLYPPPLRQSGAAHGVEGAVNVSGRPATVPLT